MGLFQDPLEFQHHQGNVGQGLTANSENLMFTPLSSNTAVCSLNDNFTESNFLFEHTQYSDMKSYLPFPDTLVHPLRSNVKVV